MKSKNKEEYFCSFFATFIYNTFIRAGYRQELLGHKSSKTTEIYTHVSKKDLKKLKAHFNYREIFTKYFV